MKHLNDSVLSPFNALVKSHKTVHADARLGRLKRAIGNWFHIAGKHCRPPGAEWMDALPLIPDFADKWELQQASDLYHTAPVKIRRKPKAA